jgi:hypothetical protein
MMVMEMPELYKQYGEDGNRLFLIKVAGALREKNAYKCRFLHSPLTFLFPNCHFFCTWKCKMTYEQQCIKVFPQRKYCTMDSTTESHWRNKIFTEKTSVLFPTLSGHNSLPFLGSQSRFQSFLTNRTAKNGEFLSLPKMHRNKTVCSTRKYVTL